MIAVGFIHGELSTQTHLTALKTAGSASNSLNERKCSISEDAGCSSWNHLSAFIWAFTKVTATWANSLPRRTLASCASERLSQPAGRSGL